jgi:hypothetical protein
MIKRALYHIRQTAHVPSFSSYEERLHPYIRAVFNTIPKYREISVDGNNLIFQGGNAADRPTIALTAHLDKINHYGASPDLLPVDVTDEYIEGAMDDCAGLGILLTLAELSTENDWPNLLFFFSEMEESKGLKKHPERLKNRGEGYRHGMGARRISNRCISLNIIPGQIITVDTTPLFKGKPGIAIYSKHWELNALKPTGQLIHQTKKVVKRFKGIDSSIKKANNTNDYLLYGEEFNQKTDRTIVSVALEPAIYPYHQKGEKVFVDDIRRTIEILATYISGC